MSNVIRNHFDPCHYGANGARMLINDLLSEEEIMTPYYNKRSFPGLTLYYNKECNKLARLLVRKIEKNKGKWTL